MKDMLVSSGATYLWTRGPPGHRVNWWQNDHNDIAVKKSIELGKAGKKVEAKRCQTSSLWCKESSRKRGI